MKNRLLILIVIIWLFFMVNRSYAHSGGGLIGDYIVTFTEEPLSPAVGEKVEVTIMMIDKNGQPVVGLPGQLLIKQMEVNEFVGKDSSHKFKEIFSKQEKTDNNGSIYLQYEFTKEALYDVEFVWGDDEETQSAGKLIHLRSKSSITTADDAMQKIWQIVGLVFVGIIIGACGAFIMLTFTLHPKK